MKVYVDPVIDRDNWDFTRCPYLTKTTRTWPQKSSWVGKPYYRCALCLIPDDQCNYPTIYGWGCKRECGSHFLMRMSNTPFLPKAKRTLSAYEKMNPSNDSNDNES